VQSNIENEQQLQQLALRLCQVIIQNNEFRQEIDPVEIERVIEEDFKRLEEFINE